MIFFSPFFFSFLYIFEWKINVKFPFPYHSFSIDYTLFSPLLLHIKCKSTARKSISYRYIKCFKLAFPFIIQCRGFELCSSSRGTKQKLCIMLQKCSSRNNLTELCSLTKFLNMLISLRSYSFLILFLFRKNSCVFFLVTGRREGTI